MREILFRGKNFDNGVWVQGYYVRLNGNKHFIYTGQSDVDCGNYYPDYYPVAAKTVGQFTGLTAQNGKIFEGDICRLSRVGTVAYGKITFKNGGYWFVDDDFGGLLRLCDCKTHGFNIEIIGNIHDNPELIGGADNG